MNSNFYKNRSNLLKGIATLCFLIFYGYYAYQDALNRNRLERSLNENAAQLQRSSGYPSARPQSSVSAQEDATHKDASETTQHAAAKGTNDYDTFQENLDNFLSDPEDEQTYPSEIFDDQMDETDDEYDRPEFEY